MPDTSSRIGSLAGSRFFLPALLALAGALAYGNSFGGPFVFDDKPSILGNPTLGSLFSALFPPDNATVSGRPVLNLSLALNYLVGGITPFGYHLVNLLVHLGCGLALFALIGRTLVLPLFGGRFERLASARSLAFAVALLWIVHPLTTEAVTYVVQRCEALAAFFVLFTLYALLRAATEPSVPRARRWGQGAVVASLLAMGSKETAAALPLLAFLFDRTFLAGTFAGAWEKRKRLHLALAATWAVLLLSFLLGHGRGATVGLVKEGMRHTGILAEVGIGGYALTQAKAIVLYLRLAFWPAPLVFDYGYEVVPGLAAGWGYMLAVGILLGGTVWAVIRRPALGFPAALAFAILAPSSSFFPIQTQTMAEHRFYLPLAAVLLGIVLLLHAAVRKERAVLLLTLGLALPLGAATWQRNGDYRSSLALWEDTAAKRPDNPRAQCNVGVELAAGGDDLPAIFRYRTAIRLRPDFGEAHTKLGASLYRTDHVAEGMEEMAEAVAINPFDALSQSNYGAALVETGRVERALDYLARAVALAPANAVYRYNLGNAWNRTGRIDEAASAFEEAVRLNPGYVEARNNLGIAYLRLGKARLAEAEFAEALRLDPASAEARSNLLRLRALGRRAP